MPDNSRPEDDDLDLTPEEIEKLIKLIPKTSTPRTKSTDGIYQPIPPTDEQLDSLMRDMGFESAAPVSVQLEKHYAKRDAKRTVPFPPEEAQDEILDDFEAMSGMVEPTQDNVARVFEIRHRDGLRFCHAWGKWLQWDKARWKPESTDLAFHFSRLIARRINKTGRADAAKSSFARGVESFARASRTFATEPKQWDSETWLLNTPGGTVDLRTGRMGIHVQGDHITKCCAVAPKPGPRPAFDRFLRDITLEDDALIAYLQRALGACLSGAIQDCFMLVWIGTGRNGKNTLGDLVQWILGDYAKVIPTETLMAHKNGPQHPTDMANLRGLRLAISSEVEEGSYFNESRIKSLTGDAEISARFMRQDYFEFTRTHKHLVYGNHRPMLRVVDTAIKKRLHLVPFKADFSDDSVCDPLMPQKLKAEAPQVLHWLIEGHALWLEDGTLKKCSAVEAETAAYFEAQSTPEMWITECCEMYPDARCQASVLYKNFSAWKQERGEGVISQTRWGEFMSARFSKIKSHGYAMYEGVNVLASHTENETKWHQ